MKQEKEYAFILYLEKLRDNDDKAALARLRRGLGKKAGTPEMFRYVVPFLSDYTGEQEHYFLLGALFALHPEKSPRGVTIGTVFRKLWDGVKSIEKRFTSLLSADAEDIGIHLRHAVSLAKSRNIPIDYHRLLYDLSYWDHPDRFVQLRWARDFWKVEKQPDKNNNSLEGEQS